jgi:Xaa-Pro aminopeptidase
MKDELDGSLRAAGFDGMLILGPADHNPAMHYFTGPVHISMGYLLKRVGQPPVLFHDSMERDEAALSGLPARQVEDFEDDELRELYASDGQQAAAILIARLLNDYGLTGKVAVYGRMEFGRYLGVLRRLQEMLPGLELTGESSDRRLLYQIRITKDKAEIERIRRMGEITVEVVARTADLLTSCRVRHGVLVGRDGQPLTIGDVKRQINLWLAERGAENPEGTIFAIGRDAGVPHSVGQAESTIPIGQTIIFDIFPCEQGGGYFYDFTRTWCLDHASDEALKIYEEVRNVYDEVCAAIQAGSSCRQLQQMTCQKFEALGHPTVMSDFRTQSGYVHSLGHGLGLEVHEPPNFSQAAANQDTLTAGHVFTVEPGLYYPERGLGVRLEDTARIRPDGRMETLVSYPKDLVLKMKG